MKAVIIVTGDEILSGKVIDSNSAYIGNKLVNSGMEVIYKITVPDNIFVLEKEIQKAFEHSQLIIISGGLGPTRDDITKNAVAEFFHKKLVFEKKVFNKINDFYKKRNLPFLQVSANQAFLPQDSIILNNDHGTAPGFLLEKKDRIIVVLPGPPAEMQPMFDNVFPKLMKKLKFDFFVFEKTIRTFGVGESFIEDKLKSIKNSKHFKIKFQAFSGRVDLRISVKAPIRSQALKVLNQKEVIVKRILKKFVIPNDSSCIESHIGEILKNKSISIAESCTGGLISSLVTDNPGASLYFSGSVVSYSNKIKIYVLGVPRDLILRYGAVSRQVAEKMAIGVKKLMKTILGISVTGIAGPGGGTRSKPVGLVYMALAYKKEIISKKFNFTGTRKEIKQKAAFAALNMIKDHFSKNKTQYSI